MKLFPDAEASTETGPSINKPRVRQQLNTVQCTDEAPKQGQSLHDTREQTAAAYLERHEVVQVMNEVQHAMAQHMRGCKHSV